MILIILLLAFFEHLSDEEFAVADDADYALVLLLAEWEDSLLVQTALATHAGAKLAVLDILVSLEAVLAAEAPVVLFRWLVICLLHIGLLQFKNWIIMQVLEHVSLLVSGDFKLLDLLHLIPEDVATLLQTLTWAVLILLFYELAESILEHLEELTQDTQQTTDTGTIDDQPQHSTGIWHTTDMTDFRILFC